MSMEWLISRDNQASPKKIQEVMRTLYHSGYTLSGLLSVKKWGSKCSRCVLIIAKMASIWKCSQDCTCHKISKTNCAQRNEAVIDGFRVGPSFLLLEHDHGHNKEEAYSWQVGYKVDRDTGTSLGEWEGGRVGGKEGGQQSSKEVSLFLSLRQVTTHFLIFATLRCLDLCFCHRALRFH